MPRAANYGLRYGWAMTPKDCVCRNGLVITATGETYNHEEHTSRVKKYEEMISNGLRLFEPSINGHSHGNDLESKGGGASSQA